MPKVQPYLARMEFGQSWAEWGLAGLFLASFLAATVLPFSSEAVLAAMALGPWSDGSLWMAASLGNWLGGMSSYGLGRLGDLQRVVRWLGVDPERVRSVQGRVDRHGAWAALLAWLPVVGDLVAIALGLARARILPVAMFMFLGKAARYAVVLMLMRTG